jgi:transposase
MSPEYVRPYVKAHKNDDRDAEAIAEAATRPTMRFVAIKSEAQLDMQTLHRVRDRLVGERTALMNQIRSILLERGHVVPQGRAKLAGFLTSLLEAEEGVILTPRMQALVADVRERWQLLDQRIAALDAEFAEQARTDEAARRLTTIPGIGALNATALVAAIGDVATFARGRDLAAWLGLVPRQVTTGGRPKLVGITKRGSKYLRKMLIQGARATMPTLRQSHTASGNGCAGSWRGRTPIRRSSPWRRRWLVSSGRCCATSGSTRRPQSQPELGSAGEALVGSSMSAGGERKMA